MPDHHRPASRRPGRTRPRDRTNWGLRSRPPWLRRFPRLVACLAVAAASLLLPPVASAATTTKITASFSGGKPGNAIHFGYTTTESAGGLPQAPQRATIHLPKGTGLDLSGVPKRQLCTYNILIAADFGPSHCPKGSHAGPVGSAQMEAVVGGKPTTVTAPVYPFVVQLHDSPPGLALFVEGRRPFPIGPLSLLAAKGELVATLGLGEISPGSHFALTGLSVTIGEHAKVTPPPHCPKGGLKWSAGFEYWEGADTTATTVSPCPAKAATATSKPTPPVAQTSSIPKTPFECDKKFHTTSGREGCFNQLPGANCAHPLEAEKASATNRGDSHQIIITYENGVVGPVNEQTYSYKPAKHSGLAICPHGVVYKVSLVSERNHCQRLEGQEICSDEYGTKNIPEPSSPTGGEFTYRLPVVPTHSAYLVVKAYYPHPPWEGRAQTASTAKTQHQCEKAGGGQAQARCLNQLPGASCAHPLVVEKSFPYAKGDTKDIAVTFREELLAVGVGAQQYWSGEPKTKNVAICPYPEGVVFTQSLAYRQLPNGMFEEVLEYKPEHFPKHTNRAGGFSFQDFMPTEPVRDWHVTVKAYYRVPPWG